MEVRPAGHDLKKPPATQQMTQPATAAVMLACMAP
jgi:hypothetical protein